MTNLLLRYGIAVAFSIACTGVTWLCVRYVDQSPYIRLYRTIPLSLTWAFGGLTLYSLLLPVFPFLDTPRYEAVGTFVPIGFGAFADIYFLWRRARYIEDTTALLILLFALIVLTLITIAESLPPPGSPPPIIAFYAAWCATGSVFLLPCLWFDRWLRRHLGPVLPLPAILQSRWTRRRTPSRRLPNALMIAIASAITATLLAGGLFLHQQGDTFVAALPWAAGLMLGMYLLGTVLHWGLRWLFQNRPLYSQRPRPRASSVTVTAEPFDDRQENLQLYQGPTAPDGSIPATVLERMDELLHSEKAVCIHYTFDNEAQGSQYLPSYCAGTWPQCQTCNCRQASRLPLPAQGGEE